MMLAGVPVLADAVSELAKTVRASGADELADRLERALDEDVKLLALTIDERAIILASLEPARRTRRAARRAHERAPVAAARRARLTRNRQSARMRRSMTTTGLRLWHGPS